MDRSGRRPVLRAGACLLGVRFHLRLLICTILLGSPTLVSPFFPVAHSTPESASTPPQTANAASLVLHEWIEREIAAGEVHSYKVRTAAGQYFSIEIEQWGLAISGEVSSPAISESMQFIGRFDNLSRVSVIAAAGGEFVITLRAAADATKVGRYQIRLKDIRPLSANDNERATIERTLAEADRLRATQQDVFYQKAIEKYQAALASLKGVSDPGLEVNAFKNLGRTHEVLGDNERAVYFYRQALTLSHQLKDQRAQAEILNCLSFLNVDIGNNREALTGAESALRLSRLVSSRSVEAQALFASGEANYGLGDLQKALDLDQQALAILRALHDYRGQTEVLLNVGYAYSSLSRTAESRGAYQEAVSLSHLVHDPRLEAKSLRALATFQTRLGEYQQALDLFRQALRSLSSIDDRLTKATVLGGMAFTYKNLGELEKALDYDNQAIALYQEIHNTWGEAEAQMDAGRVSFSLGDGKGALVRYERALSLFRSLGMIRLQAQTLRDMGVVFDSWNNKEEALNFYNQSLRLTRPGQDQRYQAYTLNYRGRTFESKGDKTKAIDDYRSALRLNRIAEDPAGEALTLYNLAHVYRDMNRLEESLAQIKTSLEISESLRSKVGSQDARASFVASTHEYFELHADILMRLHQSRPDEGFAAAAFEASENARARSLLELLKEAHADIREGVDAGLLDQERRIGRELNTNAERHADLILAGKSSEAQAVGREIDQLTNDYEQTLTQIKSASPRYAALTEPQALSLREIQEQVLDNDSLLLEYLLTDDRSYLWAVSRTEVATFELAGRAQLEEAAFRFHNLLTANQPIPGETFAQGEARVHEANAQLGEAAASLSKLVLGPVMAKLGKKRLLIVADGALQYIPFQALVVPETINTGKNAQSSTGAMIPLTIDHEIVNEPSASTLALLVTETKTRKPAANSVAVLADPVFEADDPRINATGKPAMALTTQAEAELHRALRDVNLGGDRHIPRLLASRAEAEAIISVTPWRSGFQAMDFEASRATVMKANLSDYRIVHFATHGFLNNEHPELSGIVLSLFDQDGRPQDGFLRLHDIYNLKLPVDLVVLSACNTGLGKEVKGEGLMGLTRGFMYAGASSVVASLWKVDDEATAELMRLFYGYMLRDGLSPAAALRKAQVTMSQQKRWQSPYYWAGFVIQGQYLQSPPTRRFPIPTVLLSLVGAVVVSLAVFYLLKRRRKFAL